MRILIRPKSHYLESGYLEWQIVGKNKWYVVNRTCLIPQNKSVLKICNTFDNGEETKPFVVEAEYDRTNRLLWIQEVIQN